MTTDRLELAVKNFQHVNQMVERYTRLCRAYVALSERFHQLDVEHMTLKGQVVPLLKALKAHQTRLQTLEHEKTALEQALEKQAAQHRQDLQQLTKTYEDRLQDLSHHVAELQPLEQLLSAETHHELSVAEAQMELVETTVQEMEQDSSPDLSEEEKALLAAYHADPNSFLAAAANGEPLGSSISNIDRRAVEGAVEAEEPVASMWHYYYDETAPGAIES